MSELKMKLQFGKPELIIAADERRERVLQETKQDFQIKIMFVIQ